MSAEYMTGLFDLYQNKKGRKLAFSYINKDNAVVRDDNTFWLERFSPEVTEAECKAIIKAIKEDFGLEYLYDRF